MAAADVDQRIRDAQREYADFLDDFVRNFFVFFFPVETESLVTHYTEFKYLM